MTTVGSSYAADLATGPPVSRSIARRAMLLCGVASSVLYVATDVVGGLVYGNYSFTSQAISELAAIGTRSAPVVQPLYAIYNLLALLFGVGVCREAAGRNSRLELTGLLLIMYAAIGITTAIVGFAGSTYFNMHQRGTATIGADLPHIVLTAVFVLLLLSMISVGAFSLGKRFRTYSLVTLATIVVFAALTVPYGSRMAIGQPTPWVGVIERINVYAGIAWPGVLAIALLRFPAPVSASNSLPAGP